MKKIPICGYKSFPYETPDVLSGYISANHEAFGSCILASFNK